MASESDLIKAMIPEGTFEKVLARQKSVKKKPVKQEAPVVQSFSNGGEVMPLPLSGVSISKPSSYGELFTDIDSTVRGLGKGALSVGLGLPGDLLALLGGAGSFIGIPGESFFRPEEERGFLPRLKRAAGTVDRISSGIGSLALEEAAINRLLENEAGLSDRDLALQIEALRTGAFTGPLTPAALGLKTAPKLVSTLDKIEEAVDVAKTEPTPEPIPTMIPDPKVKPKPKTKIKYNQKERRILEGDGNTGGLLRMLFADDDTYVVDTFENYGVDADLGGPAKLPKGSTLRFRDKIYNQTQESLKDQPEKMLVYRHGEIGISAHAGHPVSFTLAPFRGTLPSQGIDKNVKGVFLKDDDFEVYEVDKKDILANFEGVVPRYSSSGAGHERELLIYPDKVKLYQPSFDDDVVQGVGSLDPVKEAAQLAREERRQKKIARQEAAAFVPNEAKNTLGSSEIKADFVEQLGLGYGKGGVPRLKEFFEIADNIKYNFRSGRLLFNPDSGLGMSQANKPRNSKSVLKSFERLGVSQNELKQTGLLDYLNKNKEVTLSDLQNVFVVNKPRLKMVRINENDKFHMSDLQRLTPNPKDGDVGVGYISVDVVGHAHFDEGQPGLENILSKEGHYRGISTTTVNTTGNPETLNVPFPNPMMHTRGVTVQFDAGTKNAEKFPNGAQIIEEVQDDYLGDFRMAENLSSAEERAKLQGKISELDEVIYKESDELMNILNDDFLLNEIAQLTYRDGMELGNKLGPNKTEMPAEEYIAGNMRFQFHEFNTRNAFDDLQFNDLGEPVYVDEGGLSFGDMLKAQGVVTSPTGTKIAPKQFIKNPTELNAEMIFQFADELESIRSGERRRDGLTRDDLSTPLLNVDISKLRLLAEKVHERKRQTGILSKADELAALGVIDSSIKTKINELIPAYREKVNQFKTEIAELEQSVNNYNKITMDNTLRNEAKIDNVNKAIKNIEEKVPADSNEKVRYLPRGKFGMEDTVLLSREEALDRYADDRAFYENQLKEIRKRGDINNPEASDLTEKLGNKRKELAEYDSKFREDNPEITNFIENKKITETKEFKIDPVFKDQTGTAMYMLKQEVAVALEKGLSGVILPNYIDIATKASRGGDPADFKRTYDDAMKKLQKELEEYGFEVGTIDVPYIHHDEIIDSKPSMYIKFPEGLDNFEPEVKLAKGGLVEKQVV